MSERILQDQSVCLKIVLDIDDICRPCIHNVDGVCDDTIDRSYRPEAPSLKNDWMLLIDSRLCDILRIKVSDQFIASELCERIRDRISMGDFTDIYREIPPSMTKQRYIDLVKGLAYYLD